MTKSKLTPATDNHLSKRSANSTRKVTKLDTVKKAPIFESELKGNFLLKRPNDTWDY